MRPFLVRQITRISQPAAVVTFAVCGDQTRAVPIREHAIAEGLSSQDNGHSRSDDRLLAWKIAMQAAIEQGAALTVGARVTVLRVGQREPILLHQGLLR